MFRIREILKVLYNYVYYLYVIFLRIVGKVNFPVPPNSNMRRTSAKTIKRYIYSSLTTGLPISVAAQMNGVSFDSNCKVLDFGCGCASQLKYFTENHPNAKYFGTDIDPSSVEWVAKNYPNVSASVNAPDNKLSFDDNTMDLIYTVSTFSHFSKDDVNFWLKELSRVLKVGGLFIPTIEGPGAIDLVSKDCDVSSDFIQKELNESGIFYKNYSWLQDLQERGPAIHESVDISSYFSDEYGHTVMTIEYFSDQAKNFGLELIGASSKVICDRQDLICFRKIA